MLLDAYGSSCIFNNMRVGGPDRGGGTVAEWLPAQSQSVPAAVRPTLTELFEALSRKQFRGYIDEEDMRRFLAVLTREGQWIDVDAQITACRDPKDDKFLSLAVSGQATHIVTGDADLLALHPFQGVRIVTPGAFLETE
jgi:putative PIN family toxin of toxin-antitoxin system